MRRRNKAPENLGENARRRKMSANEKRRRKMSANEKRRRKMSANEKRRQQHDLQLQEVLNNSMQCTLCIDLNYTINLAHWYNH